MARPESSDRSAMTAVERLKGWAIAWALIAIPMTWFAWFETHDPLTRWFLAGWVVFCLGLTWLTVRFNWRSSGPDAEFPYAHGLLREPFPPSLGSRPEHRT